MTKITRFKELVWQCHPLTGSTVFCGCLQITFRELTWRAAACVLIHRHILSHWGNDHFHCICKSDRNGQISYCRWWFRTASWASRPHTAKCWCTCGSGRCLSTCSRAPCAARIWTPPSPPAVYFRGRKEKQQAGVKRMRKAAPFISARVIDFHVWVAVMARLRGKMDSESVIPQSISRCHTDSWTNSDGLRGKQAALQPGSTRSKSAGGPGRLQTAAQVKICSRNLWQVCLKKG